MQVTEDVAGVAGDRAADLDVVFAGVKVGDLGHHVVQVTLVDSTLGAAEAQTPVIDAQAAFDGVDGGPAGGGGEAGLAQIQVGQEAALAVAEGEAVGAPQVEDLAPLDGAGVQGGGQPVAQARGEEGGG